MINLIPPKAKRSILLEYWLRVLTVWFSLWSVAILIGVAILIPSYVLIVSQVKVYSDSAAEASQKILDFENVSKDLVRSSQQAGTLLKGLEDPLLSGYTERFKELEGSGIEISEIVMGRTDTGMSPAQISGEAESRQALADFRDRLRMEENVAGVDLPISNLAKDKDIQFSLTVSFTNATSS
ncbi:MAG TPA: hypothetical protein VGE31_02275 [Candidatus Paceibacterota bacterium]